MYLITKCYNGNQSTNQSIETIMLKTLCEQMVCIHTQGSRNHNTVHVHWPATLLWSLRTHQRHRNVYRTLTQKNPLCIATEQCEPKIKKIWQPFYSRNWISPRSNRGGEAWSTSQSLNHHFQEGSQQLKAGWCACCMSCTQVQKVLLSLHTCPCVNRVV